MKVKINYSNFSKYLINSNLEFDINHRFHDLLSILYYCYDYNSITYNRILSEFSSLVSEQIWNNSRKLFVFNSLNYTIPRSALNLKKNITHFENVCRGEKFFDISIGAEAIVKASSHEIQDIDLLKEEVECIYNTKCIKLILECSKPNFSFENKFIDPVVKISKKSNTVSLNYNNILSGLDSSDIKKVYFFYGGFDFGELGVITPSRPRLSDSGNEDELK